MSGYTNPNTTSIPSNDQQDHKNDKSKRGTGTVQCEAECVPNKKPNSEYGIRKQRISGLMDRYTNISKGACFD